MILLVEDNPDDEALTLRALERQDIDVPIKVVRDGAEALEYLFGEGDQSAPDELPVLMMLDLNLPKVNGLEVLRRVREDERTRTLPVVILTSSDEQSDLAQGYADHANSFVSKPIAFEEFMEAVGQLGLYWLNVNRAPPRVASP